MEKECANSPQETSIRVTSLMEKLKAVELMYGKIVIFMMDTLLMAKSMAWAQNISMPLMMSMKVNNEKCIMFGQ